jgi:hypothetical protein
MIEDLAAYFTHNLRRPILDRGDLVKMLPTLCLALILKDIPFQPTSKLGLQPPRNEFIIRHLCPEKIVLLFLWANAFKGVRDGGRYRRPGEFSVRCRSRRLLAV